MRFPGFDGDWEECELSNIAPNISSGRDKPTQGGFSLYGSTERIGTVEKPSYMNEIVLVARVGANAGMMQIVNEPCGVTDNALVVNATTWNKYVYYYLLQYNLNRLVFGSGQPLITGGMLKKIKIRYGVKAERERIVALLSLIDDRVSTQIGTIEDYKRLKGYLIDKLIEQQDCTKKIGDVIAQRAERNRNGDDHTILSVSNQKGFLAQSEQFEEREVASEDKSNYKVVRRNDFAYNPARINVGSIARLTNYDCGIVSPMYICFHTYETVLPEFLDYFFESRYFAVEVDKRLEGSVRLCLSYDGLCDIPIQIPNVEKQQAIIQKLDAISQKIALEEQCLDLFKQQKTYLLKNMFV